MTYVSVTQLIHELVAKTLREHYLKVPKDFHCACGQAWVPQSFEEGIELWIAHVLAVLGGESTSHDV